MRVLVLPDAPSLATFAADHLATLLDATGDKRTNLSLSGGSTPHATYTALRSYPVKWKTGRPVARRRAVGPSSPRRLEYSHGAGDPGRARARSTSSRCHGTRDLGPVEAAHRYATMLDKLPRRGGRPARPPRSCCWESETMATRPPCSPARRPRRHRPRLRSSLRPRRRIDGDSPPPFGCCTPPGTSSSWWRERERQRHWPTSSKGTDLRSRLGESPTAPPTSCGWSTRQRPPSLSATTSSGPDRPDFGQTQGSRHHQRGCCLECTQTASPTRRI